MILTELIEQVKKLEAGERPDKGIYRCYYLNGVGHTIYHASCHILPDQSMSFMATPDESERTLKEHWKELFGNAEEVEHELATITLHHRLNEPTLFVISLMGEVVEVEARKMYRDSLMGWNKAILHAVLAHPQLKPEDAQIIHEYLCDDDLTDQSMPWNIIDKLDMNIDMANELLK